MFAYSGHPAGADLGPLPWVGLLASGYLVAAAGDRQGWSRWRTAAWLTGCAVLAVAVSPLRDSAGDPRVHMAQHLLLGMLAPVALVLGAPVTLLLRVAPPVRRPLARLLHSAPVRLVSHPVTAAALSTGGLALVMLTPVYAAAGRHPLLHDGLHLHYLAAGYLFAWAVAGPDPAPRRPGPALRTAVLVAAAAGHAVLAKYLYAHAGHLPPGAGYDADAVRAAARLMYYGGDVAELLLAAALCADRYRRRGRRLARPLPRAGRPLTRAVPTR
ncbi:cytochrome c oxidase assembly protein [Pilimelia terevasa]|uniref:cytochrome c oxidase assembly protein n=1 Tax=Pilimelia terevasa TaxID=53372 RepID=UPI001662D1F6|nr:cytochrome c oxidase assembly protein [Pilimelia terevasa]